METKQKITERAQNRKSLSMRKVKAMSHAFSLVPAAVCDGKDLWHDSSQ